MHIHLLSNSPTRVNSGFGIACRGLALGMSRLGHEVSVSDMQNIYNKQYWNDICIYPMNSVQNATTGNLFYISEMQQLISNLKESKAEVLIIIYPAYDNVVASNHLHEVFGGKTIWYFPVDGENLPEVYLKELGKVTQVIPYTKQGREELVKGGLKNVGNQVYLGYDDKNFYRFDENNKMGGGEKTYCKWSTQKYQLVQDGKVLCKRGCFECSGKVGECHWFEEEEITANLMGETYKGVVGNLEKLKDQFGVETIFGFTGENNGNRKKIDRLLNAYSSFLKERGTGDSMLLLHTMPISNNGLNLWEYIKKYNLVGKKVLFVYGEDELGNSWSDKALNVMYNSIDVNISCSGAEGFGLPVLESMAVGIPQIGPRFSSFKELIGENGNETIGERGLFGKIQGYETLKNGMKLGLVDSKAVANIMNTIVDDKDLRKKLAGNASEWSKSYTWDNVCNEFNKILNAS